MGETDERGEYWADRSDGYDEKYADPSTVLEQEKRARLAVALELASIGRHDTVGEIGVGSGRLLTAVSDRVGQTVGVDFSSAMVNAARENELSAAYVQGTADALPLQTGTVDVLFCLGVVGHMAPETVPATIEELARVVGPDGTVILSFANQRSPFRRLRRRYVAARSGTHYETYRPEEIRRRLAGAGLEIERRRYLTYSTGLFDTRLNRWLAATADRQFGTSDTLGPLAMTWVLRARPRT